MLINYQVKYLINTTTTVSYRYPAGFSPYPPIYIPLSFTASVCPVILVPFNAEDLMLSAFSVFYFIQHCNCKSL